MAGKGKFRITLSLRKKIYGYLFCSHFMLGFVLFFLSPMIFYVRAAFNRMRITVSGLEFEFVGFDNFSRLFLTNANWMQNVFANLRNLLYTVPSVVLFSFFIAIILNQKFKGRFVGRTIFFLPVIIASGALAVLNTDQLTMAAYSVVRGTDESTSMIGINSFYRTILSLFGENEISRVLVNTVDGIIASMDRIVMASGVQILIFLAGLQTIPNSLYEASHMDGASSWENFWKITLPMLSPVLLVNTAYTVIESLAAPDNWVVFAIYHTAITAGNHSAAAAMGVLYFAIVLTILSLALVFMSKLVYYEDR